MAKLFWLQPDNTIVEFPIKGERVIIGRGGRADVRIKHPAISSENSLLLIRDNVATIEDLKSTNGTRVNGRKIDKHTLRHGDQIEVGRERLMYFAELDSASRFSQPEPVEPFSEPAAVGEVVSTKQHAAAAMLKAAAVAAAESNATAPAPTTSSSPPQRLVQASAAASAPRFIACVVMLSGAASGKRFDLDKAVTSIGKEGKQVIQIEAVKADVWQIRLSDGVTPPFINGESLNAPRTLASGDLIEMIGVRMRFEMSMAATAA
jgi:pSer/pThr/pTyr-binding forkhead associated (FHA) protein